MDRYEIYAKMIEKYVPEKQIQSEEDLKELPLFKKEGV